MTVCGTLGRGDSRWRETGRGERCSYWTGLAPPMSRGRWVGHGGSVADGRRQAGVESARSRARAPTELGFPRPALWQMQGEAACRAGEPSGQGEEPSPKGLGGRDLLAQRSRTPFQTSSTASGCGPSPVPPAKRRLAAKRPDGMWFSPTPYLRSRWRSRSRPVGRRVVGLGEQFQDPSARVSPSRSVMKPSIRRLTLSGDRAGQLGNRAWASVPPWHG